MILRPYQQAAIDAVYDHLRNRDDNPCAVIPTAGGKTPIMATICRDAVVQWNGRVLILAHVKELLQQTADKLSTVCPEVSFGIYSAGLKRRDTNNPVIVAGIQSVYRRACELDAFDLILVDEAHLIPLEGDGMYRQFLADARKVNPHLRVIGFTATPYRLKSGSICTHDGFLNHICYEVGVRELIRDGYLCPLVTKAGRSKADTDELHVRGGEFLADEVENLMDQESLVRAACEEIAQCTTNRNACLRARFCGLGIRLIGAGCVVLRWPLSLRLACRAASWGLRRIGFRSCFAFTLLRMLGPGALSLISSNVLPFWFSRRLSVLPQLNLEF